MYVPEVALPGSAQRFRSGRDLWLHSRTWDLCYITGSSLLIVLPLLLYRWVGESATLVNLVVAGAVGGPHMYATFFRTWLDRSFRASARPLLLISCAIPGLVIAGALWHFQLLITCFFFWASVHVLHQITYIMVCYDQQQGLPPRRLSRYIDWAVIFSSLYPFAAYRFVYDEFYIGATPLLYPAFLKTPIVCYGITGFFALALLLFLYKTCCEIVQGTAHYPKLGLMSVTILSALFITSYSGAQLEIAFQGLNTWHSVQYLALTWYINTRRWQRGEIDSHFMQWLVAPRASRFGMFYAMNVAITGGALLLIGLVFRVSGLPFEHCYYIVVLSFLLMHYCHDHVLFTQFAACR